MANKVTIDVEARFVDQVTNNAKRAAKAFDEVEKSAREATKEIDSVGKKNVKPKVDADTSSIDKKIKRTDDKLGKLGRKKTEAKLTLLDKATAGIEKVSRKLSSVAGKVHSVAMKIRDDAALKTLSKMSTSLKSITSKVWSTVVKIKDTFTAPLTKLKNMLFNVKTLIAGIASAWAATKLVFNPINLADAYSSAKIGFSTLLGESGGQQMMDQLDEFAKVTPFKTSGVIANAQKMMAMGWNTDTLIEDLEIIGNAAAATGKLDVGLESIVRALSQIKTKGKLSTEELNQLAEAGIAAKSMLAEGLGYGTGDEGIAKMTEDLEKGAIQSDVAIQALLAGMKRYDGMMNSMANETVEGLMSQIQDAFEINIFRKWGQGLQDGAKRGFGTLTRLLDEAEEGLSKIGDMLYDIGKTASNWVADKFQGVVDKIMEITGSFEFQNAETWKEKLSMLWKGIVADPFKAWWEDAENITKASDFGRKVAEALTKGIKAVLGITDIFEDGKLNEDGASNIAQGFAKGFVEGFDVSGITDKLVDAIGNVWGALPWWAKLLIGGYGVGKAAGGIANLAGGVANFIDGAKNVLGGFDILDHYTAASGGSGLLGLMGKIGAGAGATTSAGAVLLGGAGLAGGIAGGAALGKGAIDLYRGFHHSDAIEAEALKSSGGLAISGTLAGAAIGTAIAPGIGTLIGAGIGGVAGWIGGNAVADKIRETDDAINDVSAATANLENEQEKLAEKAKLVWQNMRSHFGDIELSTAEIARLADQIVWGDDLANFEQYTTSAKAAEAAMQSLKTASQQTERWLWKAGLGVTFNDDEIESIQKSFDEYVNSAINFAENKHYEFTAAVSLLVDVESEEGLGILESGNAFYGKVKEELGAAGEELGNLLTEALADGIINAKEQKAITAAQLKISSIMKKIADAELDAEIDLIYLKFGGAKLSADSFSNLMTQMQNTIDEKMTAYDEAYITAKAGIMLQLEDENLTQDQRDALNAQLQALVEGYTANVDSLRARVQDVELDIIADAYAVEGVTKGKLKSALEQSLADNIDPINWTPQQARTYLGLDRLFESSASAIGEYLSGVAAQLQLMEVDGDIMLKIGEVQTDGDIVETIRSEVPETVEESVVVEITAEEKVQNSIEILKGDFGIDDTYAAQILWLLNGKKSVQEQVQVLATEFGILPSMAEEVLWKITGSKDILNPFALTASEFGILSTYSYSPTVNVTPKLGTVSSLTMPSWLYPTQGGKKYRGGIIGGDSAMDAFARGGSTDRGGIVGGSTRFIRVNEESPEMIIPLSSQRRERALDLWAKTGEMLDVPGFARGGETGGSTDEGFRFQRFGGSDAPSGQPVQVDVGGIQIDISVSGNDQAGIVEAIKAQVGDIADYVVGRIADELAGQFENTPVRGGAA